jgi:hypothetical protein
MNPYNNRENLLNFQNLTPEEYENLRQRYAELVYLYEQMNWTAKEKVDSMACQTKGVFPEEYLIAFEAGVEFCKNFVCSCMGELAVAIQNYERNRFPESYEDEAYGQDSSDEIERMKEVAKANNHRTKRSKFHSDDVLNV